jgi:homoserine O-acetyltransferase/O-succinyltransferase
MYLCGFLKKLKMNIYQHKGFFHLENGQYLKDIEIAYHTFGNLNADKSNVIWICHALTANSDPSEWWKGLVGSNYLFNEKKHFIVCANILSSCYGSTSPLHINPETNQAYYHLFPDITLRDMVKAHQLLAKHLGIKKINTLIGGSLGGQQALEWAIEDKEKFEHLILLATNAVHSPWGIAFNESQRLAILADRSYYSQQETGGQKGLLAARSIALLSYRSYNAYHQSQKENNNNKTKDFNASSYQKYQGEKLVNRFNAFSYVALSKAMDSHNVGRNRESIEKALSEIKAKTLCIAIKSDILFPPSEQYFLSEYIPNATYTEIESEYGHDGFLIETESISKVIKAFFQKQNNIKKACMEFD